MPESISKMQLRAEIFSILNKYNNPKIQKERLSFEFDIDNLHKISDKKYLARVLMEEIVSHEGFYSKACAIFLLNTVEKEQIELCVEKILDDKKIKDERKVYLISILKQKGVYFEQSQVDSYIDDAEKMALDGIKRFLSNAAENPEVQIDLLDFYQNINNDERLSLLKNLKEDCEEDDYINAFSFLTYLDLEENEKEIIQNALLNTTSKYAIFGLENLSLVDKENKKISKKLKEIKFKNPKFKQDYLYNDSSVYKTYSSFVDGADDFSLIFSRIDKNNQINAMFVTVNLFKGIVSCIGFYKINLKNFLTILTRLFVTSPAVEIPSGVLVSLLNFYSKKNKETNFEIPYEYNIWKKMTEDIKNLGEDLSEYINSKLTSLDKIKENEFKTIFNSKVVESWYFTENQDKKIDKFLKKLDKENLSSNEKLNEYIVDFIEKELIRNEDFIDCFKTRILLQAYLSKLSGFKKLSSYLFTICFEKEYIKLFLSYILEKTVYFYLDDMIDEDNIDNKFKKKNKINLDKEEIKNTLKAIEEKWK